MKLLSYRSIIIIVLIVAVPYIIINFFLNKPKVDKEVYLALRTELLKKDSLLKIKDGEYEKLIEDYYTEKQLSDSLKSSNKELYDRINKKREKLISITTLYWELKGKFDSIELQEPLDSIIKRKGTLSFYYPNTSDYFITHSVQFTSLNSLLSSWEFKPQSLDLVVTETEKGLFKANISANEWMKINSVKVRSLPMEKPVAPSPFGWAYGVGGWKSPTALGVDFYGGMRFNRVVVLVRLQPSLDSQIGGALIYFPN